MYNPHSTIPIPIQPLPIYDSGQFPYIQVFVFPRHPAYFPHSNLPTNVFPSQTSISDVMDTRLESQGLKDARIKSELQQEFSTKQKPFKTKSIKRVGGCVRGEGRSGGIRSNSLLSFVGNKLLKFVTDTSKNIHIVEAFLLKHSITHPKAISDFYSYANKSKSKIINKVSIQKIRQFWLGPPRPTRLAPHLCRAYHQILRVLSFEYLSNVFPNYVLSSKKSKKKHWAHHLKIRRWLLAKLRNPRNFTDYSDL